MTWHCSSAATNKCMRKQNLLLPQHRWASIFKGESKILKVITAREDPVMLQGIKLEEVQAFTYLGSIIDKQGGTDTDVKARIG